MQSHTPSFRSMLITTSFGRCTSYARGRHSSSSSKQHCMQIYTSSYNNNKCCKA